MPAVWEILPIAHLGDREGLEARSAAALEHAVEPNAVVAGVVSPVASAELHEGYQWSSVARKSGNAPPVCR